MRHVKIFLLYIRAAWQSRAENVVYFFLAFINPMTSLIFWNGAFKDSKLQTLGWTFTEITSYYVFLAVASAILLAHIEWDVAYEDIYQGNLTQHLLKPYSYFLLKLFTELPWRILQGFFGIVFVLIYTTVFHGTISIVQTPSAIISAICIAVLGFTISFFIKIIFAYSAFWTLDYRGLNELLEVTIVVLSGFVIPLSLFPHAMQSFILTQPFAYIIYMPLLAFIGKISPSQTGVVIGTQLFWIMLLAIVYSFIWKRGVKKYTGMAN